MRLPNFTASEAARRFSSDLFREHLEEASFLYDQRRALFDDPELTWLGIGEFERRLDRHIDALAGADEVVLDIADQLARDGDPGALYPAVCAVCRHGRRDLLASVLKKLNLDDAVAAQAVCDAMKDDMPEEWGLALAPSLKRGFGKLIPLWAEYAGYRRLDVNDALQSLIDEASPRALSAVLWALGRVEGKEIAALTAHVDHEVAAVRYNAVIALLRRGEDRVLTVCRSRAAAGDALMSLPLAVAGGRSDAVLLRDVAVRAPSAFVLLALGVIGDVGAFQLLVDSLEDESIAPAAAMALHLMTGASLREEAFVPDPVDEDQLFQDELAKYRQTGEVPRHPDGRLFGTNVERLSQNTDDWRRWLAEHRAEFSPALRYRLGKPLSPGTLVETLVTSTCTRQVRALAYEELVARYRIDVPFEPEMRVSKQKKQINAMARGCRASAAAFRAGEWYFAGEPM